jgi:cytochrome c oxidase subunit IV
MGQSDHHVVPFKTYFNVFATLLVMTVVTVVVAQFNFGAMNTVIAMAIATFKATLVLAFFMHLKYDNLLNRAIFGTGVFFLLVLFAFCLTDIFTRFARTPQ